MNDDHFNVNQMIESRARERKYDRLFIPKTPLALFNVHFLLLLGVLNINCNIFIPCWCCSSFYANKEIGKSGTICKMCAIGFVAFFSDETTSQLYWGEKFLKLLSFIYICDTYYVYMFSTQTRLHRLHWQTILNIAKKRTCRDFLPF